MNHYFMPVKMGNEEIVKYLVKHMVPIYIKKNGMGKPHYLEPV